MHDILTLRDFSSNFVKTILLSFSLFLIFPGSTLAADNKMCSQGKKDLMGNYEVIQAKGGLWGFMEKFKALKDKSVVGLQADSKIRRTISLFEFMCEDGKTPSMETYQAIRSLIGDARMVFNMNVDRTPPAKVLKRVQEVNQQATDLLAKMGEK